MDLRAAGGHVRSRVGPAVRRRVGVDARSLAAFRVAVGALLVADLALRSRDLVAHYTDAGVLPRAALEANYPGYYPYSLHVLSGAAWFEATLFVVAGAFALAMLVGYRTRVATAASWLLLVSLQHRNPVVLNGGDTLLRMVLLWGVFLPLGARWSVDARRRGDGPARVATVASAALLLQVVLMYGSNALAKLRGDMWLSGEAIRYVFSLNQFTVLLGEVLKHYPLVLHAFDLLWIAMLALSPLLMVLTGWKRGAFAGLFAAMHLGMATTMMLGLFPVVAVAALVPFVPGVAWDALARRADRAVAAGRRALDRLDRALPSLPRPTPPPLAGHLQTVVVVALLLLVLSVNADARGYADRPAETDAVVDAAFLHQWWLMFAPEPVLVDGWYVAPGHLEDGRTIDAWSRSNLTWDRPPDLAATYPNARWRKYAVNLWRPGFAAQREHFAAYLCRRWNRAHRTDLESVTLVYMEQRSRLHGPEPVERDQLLVHRCETG
ncbi:MAG: HTTM domain-containing protein [Halobacteriaceae archaeon]